MYLPHSEMHWIVSFSIFQRIQMHAIEMHTKDIPKRLTEWELKEKLRKMNELVWFGAIKCFSLQSCCKVFRLFDRNVSENVSECSVFLLYSYCFVTVTIHWLRFLVKYLLSLYQNIRTCTYFPSWYDESILRLTDLYYVLKTFSHKMLWINKSLYVGMSVLYYRMRFIFRVQSKWKRNRTKNTKTKYHTQNLVLLLHRFDLGWHLCGWMGRFWQNKSTYFHWQWCNNQRLQKQ